LISSFNREKLSKENESLRKEIEERKSKMHQDSDPEKTTGSQKDLDLLKHKKVSQSINL